MKNQLLILLLFFSITSLAQNESGFFKVFPNQVDHLPTWAQKMYSSDPNVREVTFLFDQYYEVVAFEKNIHTQNYKHWRKVIDPFVNEAGFIRRKSYAAQQLADQKRKAQHLAAQEKGVAWSSLGPYETYQNGSLTPISWQVNIYCVAQHATNTDLLYAGTEGGGVFKSTDHGLSWNLVTQNEPFANGIRDVKIDPQNENVVYVAANQRVYQSVDGGGIWEELFFINSNPNQIRIHPDNTQILFLAAENGLYKSIDGGQNWNALFGVNTWDVQFHPTNPDIVYCLLSNTNLLRTQFFKSIDGGDTWEIKDEGWYAPSDPANAVEFGGKIGVTPAAPDLIYAGLIGESKTGDNGWIGVYRSTDAGETWVNPSGQDGGPYPGNYCPASYSDGYHQGFYNFDLEVSDEDPGIIWVGTIRLNESSDSAKTFQPIGAANSQRLDLIHADIQDLEVNGSEIWVASDGGLNYSTDLLQSHESRKYGIIGSDYWGFGSGWNEDVLVGGKYHNGNGVYFQEYGIGNYTHVGGVEEATGYVHPIDNRKAYFSQGWTNSTVVREVDPTLGQPYLNHPALPMFPNESYVESTSSGIYFDVRYADHLYMGSGNSFWKSTNGGASFENLFTFEDAGKVLEIVQSRNNPDLFYCIFQPGGGYWDPCYVYKSEDGGNNWTQQANVPANSWRLEISLSPDNDDEIWVSANSGGNGEKVFQSTDGGQSWENRTTATIDGQRVKDIFCLGGDQYETYIACNQGFYYWHETVGDWSLLTSGLPLVVNALEMRPFYRDNKLRLATYGRGIWEMPLLNQPQPKAQPITYQDTLFFCARDTVQFDCHSILNHQDAAWSWSFDPEPMYISDAASRNPQVVFGEEGAYDVTLAVTDGNGFSDSKTVENMVYVPTRCAPDTIPGTALYLPGNQSDYATLGTLNLNSNTVTFSAWIKPDGIQNDFAGVIFTRAGSTTVGLNFRSNNELGYHWDNAQWWWESGAFAPEGEWSHVALVVEPGQATIYLNGEPYTNLANHPVEEFDGPISLGADINWGDRRFQGWMDEVCIWNRALSIDEIRLLRHLTKERQADPNALEYDPDFAAYFQFNEGSDRLIDRIGFAHGQIAGNGELMPSTAPVGKGNSAQEFVSGSGVYDFAGTDLSMDFMEDGSLPEGNVVVSRINLLPNLLPNTNQHPEAYWIINNYGDQNFSASTSANITPRGDSPSLEAFNTPEIVQLHRRGANDDLLWELNCTAEEAVVGEDGYFGFGESCSFAGIDHQLFITADDPSSVILGEVNSLKTPEAGQLILYPNPVPSNGSLNLQYTGNEKLLWQLYDATGRLLDQQTIYQAGTIELESLASGLYFWSASGKSLIRTGKIRIE